MNKNRKSKLVLFSVIGLAAVSIGTVGFATWVVGVQKTEVSLTVKALVDDTTNSSLYLDAVASTNQVKIAEKVAYPGSGETKKPYDVITTVTESNPSDLITVDADALKFSFTKLQFSIGEAAEMPAKLKIELLTGENENVANKVTSENNKLGSSLRSGTSWNYLSFDYTYTLSTDAETDLENKVLKITETPETGKSYKTYNIENKTFTFDWGSFFGSQSPVNYYNGLAQTIYGDGSTNKVEELFNLADSAHAEIKQMKTALTAENVVLNVKLSFVK